MNYVFLVASLAVSAVVFWCLHRYWRVYQTRILKIIALTLAAIFFVRYLAVSDSKFSDCIALSINYPFSTPFRSFVVLMAVWGSLISVVLLQMVPFFNSRLLLNYAKVFGLGAGISNLVCFRQIIGSYTGSYAFSLCGAFFGLEVGLSLTFTIYLWLTTPRPAKQDWLPMLAALPLLLIFAMPPYVPRALLGTVGLGEVDNLNIYHRFYLYLTAIFLLGTYGLLKNRDREFCRMVLLYIALTTLISYTYDYDFSIFIRPTSWPLHLCNTAMFIIPLCLMFKWDKLFYFTFFINVLGAFFAMIMPNYTITQGAFGVGLVRFWINHIMAFAMPILMVILGIYRRPNLRLFCYSMIGFLIYFLFVLYVNAWFTNYNANVDFFFLNSDFIVKKLGKWAENTRNYTLTVNWRHLQFVFYPLYQILFFVVYVILGFAMWFLYTGVFQIQDFYLHLSQTRRTQNQATKLLCAQYETNNVNQCRDAGTINQLVVNNASKRYRDNHYFSIKDLTFRVKAGEILGFLGPNGAGKSTLIKCIVGIQPLTSGNITINGYDIMLQPVAAKMQFGFVPDHYALYENLTGREYLNYVADLYDVPAATRTARLEQLLKQLQMSAHIDAPIRTYSHGMKQKIAIMSALIHDPKLWILDEPLTGLDPDSIFQVKSCMKDHARHGNIVFFSSHIIDLVEKLCDRIIIIKQGHIMATTTLKALQQKKISLEKFYLQTINNSGVPDEMA